MRGGEREGKEEKRDQPPKRRQLNRVVALDKASMRCIL